MTRDEIVGRLNGCGLGPVAGLLQLEGGRVASHVYRFDAADGRRLVVKETRPNETLILRVLAHLGSDVSPRIHHPELLKASLLVWEYVTPATPGPVSAALAQAYARFQNVTEDGTIFDELALPAKRDKSGHDFYADTLIRCLAQGRENVRKMERIGLQTPWTICEVLELVGAHPNELADGFGAAPFAWIHNDFRDENIVGADGDGGGQRLIDWGSSYGYGPYLYDIAPYLLESDEAMRAYGAESTIWRHRTVDQRDNDLMICAVAALLGYLHWHLGDLLHDGDVARLQRSFQRRQAQFQLLRNLLREQ